jgi:hypothetical protein
MQNCCMFVSLPCIEARLVTWVLIDSCVVAYMAPKFASDLLYNASKEIVHCGHTVAMLRGWNSCLVDQRNRIGPIFLEGVDRLDDCQGFVLMGDPIFVLLGVHPTAFDDTQANVDDIAIIHWVACHTCVGCTNEEGIARGLKPLEGCQSAAILCRLSLRSLAVVLPYFVMNQSNMCRNTVFGCFMQMGSYVLQIAFGRFARKTSEKAAFMVTMSTLVLGSRAFVAFRVLPSLSVVQAEKSGIASTSIGNGKKLAGYALVLKKE